MKLDIEKVLTELPKHFKQNEDQIIHIARRDPVNGAILNVKGKNCASSIAFRPNGNCDVDYMFYETKRCIINHFEFRTETEAILMIAKEVRAAVKRA